MEEEEDCVESDSSRQTDFRRTLAKFQSKCQSSTKVVLGIVYFAMLLDAILMSSVVPILPRYLHEKETKMELLKVQNLQAKYKNSSLQDNRNSSYLASEHANFKKLYSQIHAERAHINENSRAGWLFASKSFIQFATNPVVGYATGQCGCVLPITIGLGILLLSTILFGVSTSFWFLFAARAIHGIGSACIQIGGLSLLAITYPKEDARSKAMGFALGGMALGVLIGYPFGGFMFQISGKLTTFICLAVLILVNLILVFVTLNPSLPERADDVRPIAGIKKVAKDPFIIIAAGAMLFPEMTMAMLEPTLPLWLSKRMKVERWQLGAVFVPDSIGFLVGTNVFGILGIRLGRWICIVVSLVVGGLCIIMIPFATKMTHLVAPHFGFGLALGCVDACVFPLLGHIVDSRHGGAYGAVYAIGQFSICTAFSLGPSIGGQLVKVTGFPWLMRGMGLCNILYAPICLFLRNSPKTEDSTTMLMSGDSSNYSLTEKSDGGEKSK